MKTADSLIISRHALGTVSPSKMLALPVKSSNWKVRIRKIQKFRSDGKQLTESQNNRKYRISKVAHSSKQWTEIGVGKMLIRSIRSLSAWRTVYRDKMQIVYNSIFSTCIEFILCWNKVSAQKNCTRLLSCGVIFIYRSIHSLWSPCSWGSGRWSWGSTIAILRPIAPILPSALFTFFPTFPPVPSLCFLSLFLASSFHVIRNIVGSSLQSISEGFKWTRIGLWASLSVGATTKMLWSLDKQVSFTLKVNSPM